MRDLHYPTEATLPCELNSSLWTQFFSSSVPLSGFYIVHAWGGRALVSSWSGYYTIAQTDHIYCYVIESFNGPATEPRVPNRNPYMYQCINGILKLDSDLQNGIRSVSYVLERKPTRITNVPRHLPLTFFLSIRPSVLSSFSFLGDNVWNRW